MRESGKRKSLLGSLRDLAVRLKNRVTPFGPVHVGGLYVLVEERADPLRRRPYARR